MSDRAQTYLAIVTVTLIFALEVVAIILDRPWHRPVVLACTLSITAVTFWALRRRRVRTRWDPGESK